MVAKPVSKSDIRGFAPDKKERAEQAKDKEWSNLRNKHVWLDSEVVEWSSIVKQSRMNGETIHLGYLHGLMVEKNSELPENDINRKLKFRVVFLGDRVRTQNWEQKGAQAGW